MKNGWKAFILVALIISLFSLSLALLFWEDSVLQNRVTVVDVEAVTHEEIYWHTPTTIFGIVAISLFATLIIIIILGVFAYIIVEDI